MASDTHDPKATDSAVLAANPAALGVAQMPFEPGVVIHGKYELQRLIGSGGLGFVVAARHIGFDDFVALKFLRPEFATHQEAVSRFTIEARASFKLRSEHVARMLDVDIYEGVPFIAMELLDGTDLRNLLEARRVLEVEPSIDYMLQCCEALAAAHALGVIHRDIKPENLFLLGDGAAADHLKVLDFGVSKVAVRGENRRTHQALTRIAVGTPPYMSPEQVRASSALDGRSDIWSVGCVLYELLTGTAPFERVSLMQACAAVLEDQPAAPSSLRTDLPEELSEIIMRCLKKDPDERFSDVSALAEALNPFGSGRLASYPARCRAHLAGEAFGRRSTPNGYSKVEPRPRPSGHNGAERQASPGPGSLAAQGVGASSRYLSVRLEGNAPLTRRVSHGASTPPNAPTAHTATYAEAGTSDTVARAAARPVTTPFDADHDTLTRPFVRSSRRRAVQVAAWGVPIIAGGLLATYLATTEQRARTAAGPSLRALNTAPQHAEAPAETRPELDLGLPTGKDDSTADGAAQELAQAPSGSNLAPDTVPDGESDATADRDNTRAAAAAVSAKRSTSARSSETKTKTRGSHTNTLAQKPAPQAAPVVPPSDPDVGF